MTLVDSACPSPPGYPVHTDFQSQGGDRSRRTMASTWLALLAGQAKHVRRTGAAIRTGTSEGARVRIGRLFAAAVVTLLLAGCASSSVPLAATRGASVETDGYRFETVQTWRGRSGSIPYPPSATEGIWSGAFVRVSASTLLDSPTAQVVDASDKRLLGASVLVTSPRDPSGIGPVAVAPPGRYVWNIWFALPDTSAAAGSALVIKAGSSAVRVQLDQLLAGSSGQ